MQTPLRALRSLLRIRFRRDFALAAHCDDMTGLGVHIPAGEWGSDQGPGQDRVVRVQQAQLVFQCDEVRLDHDRYAALEIGVLSLEDEFARCVQIGIGHGQVSKDLR